MDHIDVHDLPEEEARFIATLVEFLRRRKPAPAPREVQQAATTPPVRFAVWPLGVQGTLSREDIYDHL